MDKRVIFAVAGAGKTTYIVDLLSGSKRYLIVTYTLANYANLCDKIARRFDGMIPENIKVLTYFSFLYEFCYKPYLSDKLNAKGICFKKNELQFANKNDDNFFFTKDRYVYSNRLALLIQEKGQVKNVIGRLEKCFDVCIIDEVQDIAGRDFNFLEDLMSADMDMLFVGDYYQHTYDTSYDGNVNKNLFKDMPKYAQRFTAKGFCCDTSSMSGSWRCGPKICKFVSNQLGINISSNFSEGRANGEVIYVSDEQTKHDILSNPNIIKLHYENGPRYGQDHNNWGKVKGNDNYQDVCVFLNKTTSELYHHNKLVDLSHRTKNKLYVAITRAHRNVYLIDEQ